MPIESPCNQVAVGLFWPSNGLFGKNLINMDLILVLPIIQVNIDRQTNL